jgi:nucleoside-diphosphate-sugar epimerase
MENKEQLSTAIAKCTTIVSLLGPSTTDISQAFHPFQVPPFAAYYTTIIELMKEHKVRRIFAMSTISYPDPSGQDRFGIFDSLLVWAIYLAVHSAYTAVTGIAETFRCQGTDSGIDWTVFRLAGIPGGSDEASWRRDRESDWPVVGTYIGSEVWKSWTRRGALARWLADCAVSGAPELVGKMPAVSRIVGGKTRTD